MRPGIKGTCKTVFVLTLSYDQVSRGPVNQFLYHRDVSNSFCTYHVTRPVISGRCQTLFVLTLSSDQVSVGPVKQFLYLPCHATWYQWGVSNSFSIYLVMRPVISGKCQTLFVLTLSSDQISVGRVKQWC